MEPLQEGVPLTEEQIALVKVDIAEAEKKAEEDKDFMASLPDRRKWRVAISKLLKHPLRYVRSLPPHVDLVGVNTLGRAILTVVRKGQQLSTRGQGWAMQEFMAKLPPVKEPVPTTTPDAATI